MADETIIAEGVTLKDGWLSGLGAKFFENEQQAREYAPNGLPKADGVQLTPEQIEELQKPAAYPTT